MSDELQFVVSPNDAISELDDKLKFVGHF